MNNDLKIIKKKYGEKMMHYCREELSTILECEGLLPELFLSHFHENHSLYEDIEKENKFEEFKNYIYSLIDVENNMEIITNKTPKELLSEAGYELYECKSEEDIQKFKKYYAKGEKLCTFKGNRLDKCYVFFAVKKNVNEIKRENFTKPERQDLYGTSVISIQFTKKAPCTLSIKNRYNHKVNNPDATFSNNLDNIIPGLTKSFENEYGFIQTNKNNGFELKNYVPVNGKYYKYNYEIEDVYYCPDNIVINHYEIEQYDKERYIVFDYFILDLKEKKLISKVKDAFVDTITEIEKINVIKINEEKEIHITPIQGEKIIIKLDKENRIISYTDSNVLKIGYKFLYKNENLIELNLPNLEQCGVNFLYHNNVLTKINLPNLKQCEVNFLNFNEVLTEINLPNLKEYWDSKLIILEYLKENKVKTKI